MGIVTNTGGKTRLAFGAELPAAFRPISAGNRFER